MANVNTLLDNHVVLRYELIDRLYLNGYVPRLQTPEGLAHFLSGQPGEEISRYAILGERTAGFNRALERFGEANAIPVVHFERGQRKEGIAQPYLDAAERARREGVVLIGIAQERASVFRPPAVRDRVPGRCGVRRRAPTSTTSTSTSGITRPEAPFLKLCTYAPWSLRVWLNGHSWAKRPSWRVATSATSPSTTASPASTTGGPSRPPATACLPRRSSASSGGCECQAKTGPP